VSFTDRDVAEVQDRFVQQGSGLDALELIRLMTSAEGAH
jgi:hypothetical protein